MEKVEKVTFSVAIVLFDMKMHSDSSPKKFYKSSSLGDHHGHHAYIWKKH